MGIEARTGQYEFSPDPDLDNILSVWARKVGLQISCSGLGTVVAYDPVTQEASVTYDFLKVNKVTAQLPGGIDPNEINAVAPAAPKLLTGVPVFPAGGSGDGVSYLTFPILPGSTGVLIVLDRSRDTWMSRTAPIPVDPIKSAIHSLSDAIFFPGVTTKLHRITPPTSLVAAVLEAPLIKIGANAVSNVVKAELLDALDAFANAVPVPNDGGAAIQTAFKVLYQALRPMLATTKAAVE